MTTTKSPRNKTIDFQVEQGDPYLKRCLTTEDVRAGAAVENSTINGDLFDVIDYVPDNSADLIVADPPYNRNKEFGSTSFRKGSHDWYAEFTRRWLEAVLPKLKSHGSIYICADWQTSIILAPLLEESLTIQNRITWQREKGRGSTRNWKNAHEDVWFCTKGKETVFNVDAVKQRRRVMAPYREGGVAKDWLENSNGRFRDTHPSNFWDDITVPFWSMPENTAHPTQKPEKLVAKMILASTSYDDLVLDPFLGSGTTSVVAKKLGRRYVGIEKESLYCAWSEFRIARAAQGDSIQGYDDGVFWERNTRAEMVRSLDGRNVQ